MELFEELVRLQHRVDANLFKPKICKKYFLSEYKNFDSSLSKNQSREQFCENMSGNPMLEDGNSSSTRIELLTGI